MSFSLHCGMLVITREVLVLAVQNKKKQKVAITELLQDTIKSLRKEYNIRGDELSQQLDKGASYISQVENGKIKEIDFDLLVRIFQHIIKLTDVPFNNFMINYMNNFIQYIAKKALLNEIWIHLLVMQELKYPITDAVIDLIKVNLHNYNYSAENLVKKINYSKRNRLSSDYIYEPNKLYVSVHEAIEYDNNEYNIYTDIQYKLPSDFITQILNREISMINYITLYGIMYNIFLLKDTNDSHGALVTTENFLYNNNFFTAIEIYNKFHEAPKNSPKVSDDNLFSHYDDLIVNYTNKFQRLKKDVLGEIEYALDHYFHYGQEVNTLYKMEEILKNMCTTTTHGDLGLIMAILASPIYEISIDDRDFFWEQYKEIINKFINYNSK